MGGITMRRILAIVSAVLFAAAIAAVAIHAQQDKSKRPSPPATAKCDLPGGKSITVDYSSPRAKGRKIFGDIVQFGEPWRTGANEATTFDQWVLIVSKKTGEWGIPYPGADSDLVRADMKASSTSALVENFTIAFDKGAKGCSLRIEWENTRATIDISTM
jgi:hypothetical protein